MRGHQSQRKEGCLHGQGKRGEGRGRSREGRGGEGLPGKRKGSLLSAKNAVAFPGGLRKEGERERGMQE